MNTLIKTKRNYFYSIRWGGHDLKSTSTARAYCTQGTEGEEKMADDKHL